MKQEIRGGAYNRGVARVIGVVQEPVVFGFGDGLDLFEVAVGNRIAHRGEGLDALGQRPIRVAEDRQGRLGELASDGDRHALGNGFWGRIRESEKIGKLGQCALGGHVEAGNHTGSGQTHARGIDRAHAASET